MTYSRIGSDESAKYDISVWSVKSASLVKPPIPISRLNSPAAIVSRFSSFLPKSARIGWVRAMLKTPPHHGRIVMFSAQPKFGFQAKSQSICGTDTSTLNCGTLDAFPHAALTVTRRTPADSSRSETSNVHPFGWSHLTDTVGFSMAAAIRIIPVIGISPLECRRPKSLRARG